MTAAQWQSCWSIYNEVKGLPAFSRQAFVESSSSDPEVILEVLTLLNASDPANETEAAMATRTGAAIGKYEVGDMLGAGGMGEVYAARDTSLGRAVALKLLRPDSVGDAASIKRFVGEARAASALNHPNIVTVYEVIPSDFGLAIAMELVEGKSLREHIAAGLSLPDVIACGRQIALALEAAHAASIVHRDVKPENIMLRPDGVVKVLDFGLARELHGSGESAASSTAGLPGGTLKYMSPEQLRGERVTGASDVFALGMVLYEMSTGRHPFASGQLWEVAGAIANSDPAPPAKGNPAIPAHLNRLILAMLAKNPAERPTASDAARVLAGEQEAPRVRRRRIGGRWWAAAAVAAAAIGAGVAVSRLDFRAPRELAFYDVTTNAEGNPVLAAALSPDGKRFVYADESGLFLRDAVERSSAIPLNGPENLFAQRIVWPPNGRSLTVSLMHKETRQPSIWYVDLDGAAPRLIREGAREGTPSPDGTQIAFSSPDSHDLFVAPMAGGEDRKIAVDETGKGFPVLAWSAKNGRVGYLNRRETEAVYRWVDPATGGVTASQPMAPAGSGTMMADGTLLIRRPVKAAVNLWIHDIDPRTGAQRVQPRQITYFKPDTLEAMEHLSASADGSRVLTVRSLLQAETFVAEFDPTSGRLKDTVRLTFDKKADYPHAWTRDGKSVIFESSRRSGEFDLYQQAVGDRMATALSPGLFKKALAQMTADGRWILFMGWTTSPGEAALYRIPAGGGAAAPVPIGGPLDEFRCALKVKRCVLRTIERDRFVFWALDAESGKGRELVRVPGAAPMLGDWALSSSGTEIAIPVHSSSEARLRVFALEGPRAGVERIIEVPGQRGLGGIAYRADDQGWFGSVSSRQTGSQLLHIGLTGQSQTLRDCSACTLTHLWAVPSPDGRHVALLDFVHEANVAILDR